MVHPVVYHIAQERHSTVAILEIKKGGGHCGAKENVGGATKMSILHGDFSLL